MGKALSRQSPTALEGIDELDNTIVLVTLGLSRWLPISFSKKSCLTRDHLHQNLERLYIPLDMMAEDQNRYRPERDLRGASHLIKDKSQL